MTEDPRRVHHVAPIITRKSTPNLRVRRPIIVLTLPFR